MGQRGWLYQLYQTREHNPARFPPGKEWNTSEFKFLIKNENKAKHFRNLHLPRSALSSHDSLTVWSLPASLLTRHPQVLLSYSKVKAGLKAGFSSHTTVGFSPASSDAQRLACEHLDGLFLLITRNFMWDSMQYTGISISPGLGSSEEGLQVVWVGVPPMFIFP